MEKENTARLAAEINSLKAENQKLNGQDLELPPGELRPLLDKVTEALRKTSDKIHLEAVKTDIEGSAKFSCPMTLDIFTDPVTAVDGMTYERENIERWITQQLTAHRGTDLNGQWKSPQIGNYHSSTILYPNKTIKSLMEDAIQQGLIAKRVEQVSR